VQDGSEKYLEQGPHLVKPYIYAPAAALPLTLLPPYCSSPGVCSHAVAVGFEERETLCYMCRTDTSSPLTCISLSTTAMDLPKTTFLPQGDGMTLVRCSPSILQSFNPSVLQGYIMSSSNCPWRLETSIVVLLVMQPAILPLRCYRLIQPSPSPSQLPTCMLVSG
jgi:hypothetical protein